MGDDAAFRTHMLFSGRGGDEDLRWEMATVLQDWGLCVASPQVKLLVPVRFFRGRPPQGFMRQMLSGWKKSEARAEQLARIARADADDPSDANAKKVRRRWCPSSL